MVEFIMPASVWKGNQQRIAHCPPEEMYPFRLKQVLNHRGHREMREHRETQSKYAIFFVCFVPLCLCGEIEIQPNSIHYPA